MKRVFLLFLAFLVLFPSNAHAQSPQTGSITIHKEASSFDSPGLSLAGIEFQINRLSEIDVMSEAGRKALETLSVADVLKGQTLIDAPLYQQTTLEGSIGVARFTDLPIGAYLVQELPSRTGDVSRAITSPFFVSIPYFSVDGTYYNVEGKPKIQPITLTKSADVSYINAGDKFDYTLDAVVPLPDTNGELHRFVIKDTVPDGLEVNDNPRVTMRGLNYQSTLQQGTHYSFTVDNNRDVTLRFSPNGLTELARARQQHFDLTVQFTFESTASKDLADGTRLHNIAYFYPDGYPDTDDSRSIPSNEVVLAVRKDDNGIIVPPIPTIPTFPSTPDTPGYAPDPTDPTGSTNAEKAPEKRNILASTGASVIAMIVFGLILATIGVALIWKRQSNEQ
ncbi:SpaH/EbpB family LPXTG-anchored major pilin [Corynebacterium glutamicum]|uniref:SpaH/EbpB family LPXTG-anchored major pilin n=1 Tax=Corynebacterium glutamicum TaxID=1718 RepID=UPI003C7CF6E1